MRARGCKPRLLWRRFTSERAADCSACCERIRLQLYLKRSRRGRRAHERARRGKWHGRPACVVLRVPRSTWIGYPDPNSKQVIQRRSESRKRTAPCTPRQPPQATTHPPRPDDQGMKTTRLLFRSAMLALAGLGVQQLWRRMFRKKASSEHKPSSPRSRTRRPAKEEKTTHSGNHHPRRGMKRHG